MTCVEMKKGQTKRVRGYYRNFNDDIKKLVNGLHCVKCGFRTWHKLN